MDTLNALSGRIIAGAIEVHKTLGPGLLESAYEEALCHELTLRGLSVERQKPVPVYYKGIQLECIYRLDMVVNQAVVVELKACASIEPVHKAQLLTYLRVAKLPLGLLLNFNHVVLKEGIVRMRL
jgi:GxxExxY protein